jgi:hypothetical protein
MSNRFHQPGCFLLKTKINNLLTIRILFKIKHILIQI